MIIDSTDARVTGPVTITNRGALTVNVGRTLSVSLGAGATLAQAAGTFTNHGTVTLAGGNTFVYTKARIVDQAPIITDATLSFAPGAVAKPGTAFVLEGAAHLTGGVPANATVTVRGSNAAGDANTTVDAPLTNNGVIDLTSIDASWAATLTGAAVTSTGAIRTSLGAGGPRNLDVDVINGGSVTIDSDDTRVAGATITNQSNLTVDAGGSISFTDGAAAAFVQQAGTLTVDGSMYVGTGNTVTHSGGTAPTGDPLLRGATLTFGAGATAGAGTGYVLEGAGHLGGDIPANATVTVQASTAVATRRRRSARR